MPALGWLNHPPAAAAARPGPAAFDVAELLATHATVYLLGGEEAQAAPLVCALTTTGLPRGAHRRRRRIVELGATPPNGVCSHSDRRRDHPRPTWAEPQPSLTLVQMRPQSLEPTRQ